MTGAMLFAALMLLVPARAVADDGLGDAVGDGLDQVTGAAAATATSQVTQAAGTAASHVTNTVANTANHVTQAAGTAASHVTQSATKVAADTVSHVTHAAGDAAGHVSQAAGNATNVAGTTAEASASVDVQHRLVWADGPVPLQTGPESVSGEGTATSTTVTTIPTASERAFIDTSAAVITGTSNDAWAARLGQSSETYSRAQGDPCKDQPQLVCLGLLYGLGAFADAGTQVLGILAMTGLGIIGLFLLSLGLGIAGSGALVASRHRSVVVVD